MCCRMFGCIPDLYPLDASGAPQCDNQKCLHLLLSGVPRGQSQPWLRTHGIEREGGAVLASVVREDLSDKGRLSRALNEGRY